MRLLITGANGFIGKFLIERLKPEFDVIAGIRKPDTTLDFLETRLIPSLSSNADWSGIFEDIDIVIHLAARVHVMNETAEDPLEEFMEVNSRGALRMAEAAAEQGVERFVFMSTIKVHGEGGEQAPYQDTDLPNPIDPYGISKWDAEQKLRDLCKQTSMDLIVLRSPVVYGNGVKGNIELFSKLVKKGLPLPLGLVNNRRTMLSLNNLAIWVSRALTSTSIPERAVLMGDPNPTSTKLLASALAEGMGKKLYLVPIPVKLMNLVARTVGKSDIASRLFGNLELQPSFSVFDGISSQLVESKIELRRVGAEILNQ